MATTKVKLLDQKISFGSQSVELVNLLALGDIKLRIKIKSDSYKFQSFARIERWDGTQWQEVASLHYGAMKTEAGLCYKPNQSGRDFRNFEADYDELLKQAKAILL